MPVSSDAALHLGLLSHAIALERWTDAEVRRIARLLDANERDILLHLARDGARLTPYQLARRRQLFLDLRRLNSKAYERLGRELTVSLQTLATYEAAFGGRLLEALLPAGVLPARLPSPYDLRAVVLELPLVGSTFPRQISKLARARFRRIRSDVSYGLVQGETTQEIIRRVIAGRKLGKVQAEALVRTAVAHVSNRSRDLLYRDGASVLAGVEWVSTLDGRTTPTCRALDGQVFPIDSGPRPPAHYQCRSTTVPITKSWEELGLGGMGLPETRELLPPGVRLRPLVRDTRPVRKIPKGQRAGKIGQVSADVNYSAWLAVQPPRFQDAVLGPRRGAIFRANPGLHLSALMRNAYEPLTLEELARIDDLIVEAVGRRVVISASVPGFEAGGSGFVKFDEAMDSAVARSAAREWWGQRQAGWAASLAKDEMAGVVVAEYTAGWHRIINKWLREVGQDLGRVPLRDPGSRALERALAAAVVPDDVIVFRGFAADAALFRALAAMEPGGIYIDHAWMSTSATKHQAWSGDILLEIRVPRGASGVGWISPLSAYPDQVEVLIQHGARSRLLARGPATGGLARRKKWKLHLVVQLLP